MEGCKNILQRAGRFVINNYFYKRWSKHASSESFNNCIKKQIKGIKGV
jgi:hypothetical protein